jgi:nucleoside-diphosphate-sugar epimerase
LTHKGKFPILQPIKREFLSIINIVNLVAINSETGDAAFEVVNLDGMKDLLHAAKKIGVKKFIYMSNLGAGPDRCFLLLYTKWQAEEEVRNIGIDLVILLP